MDGSACAQLLSEQPPVTIVALTNYGILILKRGIRFPKNSIPVASLTVQTTGFSRTLYEYDTLLEWGILYKHSMSRIIQPLRNVIFRL